MIDDGTGWAHWHRGTRSCAPDELAATPDIPSAVVAFGGATRPRVDWVREQSQAQTNGAARPHRDSRGLERARQSAPATKRLKTAPWSRPHELGPDVILIS